MSGFGLGRGVQVGAVLVAGIALLWGLRTSGGLDMGRGPADLETLTRPLRLQASRAADFREFVLALRIHKYRAKLVKRTSFAAVYYDTPDFALGRRGYSYRFQRQLEGGHPVNYSLRFERERWAADAHGSGLPDEIDVRTKLVPGLGKAILGGAWPKAIDPTNGLKAPRRLAAILKDLGIDRGALAPRLEASLERDRYDVTDKGRTWFELDRERWRFRRFGEAGSEIALEDLVLDTRLKKSDPELLRRVRSMARLAQMVPPIVRVERAPHERAIERLRAP